MIKKTLAGLLCSSLILLSPGLGAYAAAANVVGGAAGAKASVTALPATRGVTGPAVLGPAVVTGLDRGLPTSIPSGVMTPAAAGSVSAEAASGIVGTTRELLANPQAASLQTDDLTKMGDGEARDAGQANIDRLAGGKSIVGKDGAVEAPEGSEMAKPLPPAYPFPTSESMRKGPPAPPSGPNLTPRGPGGSRILGFFGFVARVGAGAGALYGLNWAAGALFPGLFGLVAGPAMWVLAGGALWLAWALHGRYRLSLRDSKGLTKTKWAFDAGLGIYVGALALAVPAFLGQISGDAAAAGLSIWGALAAGLTASLGAKLSAGSTLGGIAALATPVRGVNAVLGLGALTVIPLIYSAGAAGLISLAPLVGAMALAAIVATAFFTPQLINSAETGRPFSGLGSMQKFRFPTFPWLMTGVVFALMTGYVSIWTTPAWILWMLFGNAGMPTWTKGAPAKQNLIGLATNFNLYYVGLLIFTAATGFASPLTFLVIAFSIERMAVWTEGVLGWLIPAQANPSTRPTEAAKPPLDERVERAAPKASHWLRTSLLLGVMFGGVFLFGWQVVGIASMAKNLGIAALLTGLPLIFSGWMVKKVMRAEPTDATRDPEVFGIMAELRERINKERAARGGQPIPMPEIVNIPMDVPNAFATGRDPNHALVGVTNGIKNMLIDAEGLREGLVRLLGSPNLKASNFEAFRIAMAGGVAGVTLASTPAEAAQAVQRASAEELKAFGTRLLRGVLGHEFMHVMDRHMVTGGVAGAMTQAIGFAAYGVLWAVGTAKKFAGELKDKLLGRDTSRRSDLFDPLTVGGALAALPALFKIFAALWASTLFSIVQMAASRNNESQADADGGKLTEDPAALALALGLLTTWRPAKKFKLPLEHLPLVGALAARMTVNPLQQMHEAGVLPSDKRQLRLGGDGAFQELFLTHPNTDLRIEELLEMARRAGHDKNPPGSPPPSGGGGSQAPPTQAAPGSQAQNDPASGRVVSLRARAGGLVRGAWTALKSAVRVLPDPARNRAFWRQSWGLALLNVGTAFHYPGLQGLLAPKSVPEQVGVARVNDNRSINSASQAVSSVYITPIIDSKSVGGLLLWTHVWRGLLMLPVPFLYYWAWTLPATVTVLGFSLAPMLWFVGTFHLIIFAAGFLQNISQTAGYVALNRIVRGYEGTHGNKANAVQMALYSVTGVVFPLLASYLFIPRMTALFAQGYGPEIGYALCYVVYAAVLLLVGFLYRPSKLIVPRDPLTQARADLAELMKGKPGVLGVRVERGADDAERLVIETRKGKAVADAPTEFAGYPVTVAAREHWALQLFDGFKTVWGNRFLRRHMLFAMLPLLLFEVFYFSIIPLYMKTMGAAASAFGMYMSAGALGAGVVSLLTAYWPQILGLFPGAAERGWKRLKADAERRSPGAAARLEAARHAALAAGESDILRGIADRYGVVEPALWADLKAWSERFAAGIVDKRDARLRAGLDPLERQAKVSSWLLGLSWASYVGVIFAPTMGLSMIFMVLSLALAAPATNIWSSVIQKVIGEQVPESMGKVYAFQALYGVAFAVVGLVGGKLLVGAAVAAGFSVSAILVGAAALILLTAVVEALEPYFQFPLKRRRS